MAERSDRHVGLPGWASRALLAGLFAMVALVAAGRSYGALTPHFVVSSTVVGAEQTVTISASKPKADDAVGRVQIFVPTGFTLNAPGVGTGVGKATAKVLMRDIDPNTELSWAGTVAAIAPTDPSIAYEGSSCDTSQHLAAWMVQLNGSKGTFSFPIFVDATSGTNATLGPYVLVACFRPSDTAAGTANRSPDGNAVDSFSVALTPFVRPTTAGAYRWRSLWTPFTAGTGALNTAGNVEAQSVVNIPAGQIVIFGKKSTLKAHGKTVFRVLITGQVREGGETVGPVLVTIRHGSSKTKLVSLGGVKTGSDSGFTKFATLLTKSQYFQASANVLGQDLGAAGCQASFGSVPCVDASVGAGRLVSGMMLVKR
jgi:hypothetical protein